MKKIPQLVNSLGKSLALVFLISLSVFSASSQNIVTSFNSTEVNAANVPNENVSLSVYPNPAADEAKLVFNASKYDVPYQVRIINNAGIQLKNIEGTSVEGQNTIRIHVGDYPPGVYYIQLLTATHRETLKLLKQPLSSF